MAKDLDLNVWRKQLEEAMKMADVKKVEDIAEKLKQLNLKNDRMHIEYFLKQAKNPQQQLFNAIDYYSLTHVEGILQRHPQIINSTLPKTRSLEPQTPLLTACFLVNDIIDYCNYIFLSLLYCTQFDPY